MKVDESFSSPVPPAFIFFTDWVTFKRMLTSPLPLLLTLDSLRCPDTSRGHLSPDTWTVPQTVLVRTVAQSPKSPTHKTLIWEVRSISNLMFQPHQWPEVSKWRIKANTHSAFLKNAVLVVKMLPRPRQSTLWFQALGITKSASIMSWVASARSSTWTFSADWRSCVDSQVLFKAHLYVRGH